MACPFELPFVERARLHRLAAAGPSVRRAVRAGADRGHRLCRVTVQAAAVQRAVRMSASVRGARAVPVGSMTVMAIAALDRFTQ